MLFEPCVRSMAAEDIIRRIVSVREDLSLEDVRTLIEAKKSESDGYLTDEVAARIVAAELGVEISRGTPRLRVLIKNLVSGLGKVTVIGRVIAVFPPRVFVNALGTEKKKVSLLIADKTGILRIVLWNEETGILESLRINRGKIVQVSNGYILEGSDGNLELRLGRKGKIEVGPKGVKERDYPMLPRLKKIGKVSSEHRNRRITLIGKILERFPLSSFERRDNSVGRVLRLLLADGTGELPVVAWNERAEALENIAIGSHLLLVNAKVKERPDQRLEAHVDHRTYVEVLDEEELTQILLEKKPTKISEIKSEGTIDVLEGHVVAKPLFREVKTSKGESVKLATLEIGDETGKIWVSAWRALAELASKLRVGDQIRIENARVKKGFEDRLEITTMRSTRIVVKQKEEKV